MLRRVLVRSRNGNFILAIVGALYALSSLIVLAWFTIDVWQAAGLTDLLVQIALVVAALCGVWFVWIAYPRVARHYARGASKPASIHR